MASNSQSGLARRQKPSSQAPTKPKTTANSTASASRLEQYQESRRIAIRNEASMGFEFGCAEKATAAEKAADKILQRIKEQDMSVYQKASPRTDSLGQSHARFYGDHFLSNVELIEKTRLFSLCKAMPKGAHLHIHFNANLHPNFLLSIASKMDRMYIWSSMPLTEKAALDKCRIQFSILSEPSLKEKNPGPPGSADVFTPGYSSGWMSFKLFRAAFPKYWGNVDNWLQNKLVFHEEETHNPLQTAAGAWENFNMRTQMMKGLFNYKTAYVKYTSACLADFAKDNIQYAEIRPNFMTTNQVWEDDGLTKLNNEDIMNLIISGYEEFQEVHEGKILKGLKVIYCTPRSFGKPLVAAALKECLEFKKKFPKFIAGFDLVGEEGNEKPHPLEYFAEEFLKFQADCRAVGEDIPFLFHCGETQENGTATDKNLFDAVLLGAKRIGHGFAVPWHPWVMAQMKAKDICVELCPISNEILGLTPRIGGHSAYTLLANNVPCTLSTDNGTLFRSTLSHDFYQIMAGKRDMTLFGFRQLIEWSIKHSCMDRETKKSVHDQWGRMWAGFVSKICSGEFGGTDSSGISASPRSQPGTASGTAGPRSQPGATSGTAGPRSQPGASRGTPGPRSKPGATGGTFVSRKQHSTTGGTAGQHGQHGPTSSNASRVDKKQSGPVR